MATNKITEIREYLIETYENSNRFKMEINKIIEEMREYLGTFVDSNKFRECLLLRHHNDNKLCIYEHANFCLDLSVHHDKIYDYLRNYLKNLGKSEMNYILYSFGLNYSEKVTIEWLQILIDNGADVNTKDFDYTILGRYLNQVFWKDFEYTLGRRLNQWQGLKFIDLLLKNGADVNMIDINGKIPLEHYLMFFNGLTRNLSIDIIMLLLNAGSKYKFIDYKQYYLSQTNEELYLNCISAYEGRHIKPANK